MITTLSTNSWVETKQTQESLDQRTPMVALTACAMAGDAKKCLAAGFDEYISKPIVHRELVQIIVKHLTSKEATISTKMVGSTA